MLKKKEIKERRKANTSNAGDQFSYHRLNEVQSGTRRHANRRLIFAAHSHSPNSQKVELDSHVDTAVVGSTCKV